jgi:hypothetical protein
MMYSSIHKVVYRDIYSSKVCSIYSVMVCICYSVMQPYTHLELSGLQDVAVGAKGDNVVAPQQLVFGIHWGVIIVYRGYIG